MLKFGTYKFGVCKHFSAQSINVWHAFAMLCLQCKFIFPFFLFVEILVPIQQSSSTPSFACHHLTRHQSSPIIIMN